MFEDLMAAIEDVKAAGLVCPTSGFWTDLNVDETEDVSFELSGLFIKNGQPDYPKILRLTREHAGYRIEKGESDSCGWLTGVLVCPDHTKFVFG